MPDPQRPVNSGTQGDTVPELLARGRSYSFEFFPPKDDAGAEVLWQSLRDLEPLRPTYVSVTYGAGGTTRDRTIEIIRRIAEATSLLPMAHLTCVGHTVAEVSEVVRDFGAAGIRNVLVLRGDPEDGPGTPWVPTPGGLSYASELVALVRTLGDFAVGVAAFPEGHREAASLDDDVRVLRAKQDAGAEFAVTEMVFRADDYFSLLDRAEAAGVGMPIIPGIMPITTSTQVRRLAELSGRDVPDEVVWRIDRWEGDRDAVRAEGVRIASELCGTLLDGGAPGLHFYTLNRSKATREIYANLCLPVA